MNANIQRPRFDEPRDYDGFSCLRARIGRQVGTEKIGLSLFEVPPGQAAYPYHWHVAEEELIIVIAGRPELRTPDSAASLVVAEGVVSPRGEGRRAGLAACGGAVSTGTSFTAAYRRVPVRT